MLTAITKEFGIPSKIDADGREGDPLDSLLLFKAQKATGDYHTQMNSNAFLDWLENQLFPALKSRNIKAILVLDNASYHCVPAEGSINVDSFTSKEQILEYFHKYGIEYKEGRANNRNPEKGGDSLDVLKDKFRSWLKINADEHGLIVGKKKIDVLCEKWGHFPPLWTPPYHPELQPIEHLWRDVKQYVARKYVGGRTMTELYDQVREGFRLYGTMEWVSDHFVKECLEWEQVYKTKGFEGDIVPASWDDYILSENQDNDEDINDGIMDDIEEEDNDDEDGFAMTEFDD